MINHWTVPFLALAVGAEVTEQMAKDQRTDGPIATYSEKALKKAMCDDLPGDFLKLALQPYYIDKSLFIKHFIKYPKPALAITGPSRFGKTSHLDMLKTFFQPPIDKDGKSLDGNSSTVYKIFSGLKIKNTGYFKHFGTHAVINFDFKRLSDFKSYEHFLKIFEGVVSNAFFEHTYLRTAPKDEHTREVNVNNFRKCYSKIGIYSEADLLSCGQILSQMLKSYFNTQILILIDEISVPFDYVLSMTANEVAENMYSHVTEFLGKFVSNLVKAPTTWRAFLTGIMRFGETYTKYAENLTYESIFDKIQWCETYGFTKSDMGQLSKQASISKQDQKELKFYFEGYKTFDETSARVYNPGNVIDYITRVRQYMSPTFARSFCSGVLDYFDVLLEQKKIVYDLLHVLDVNKRVTILNTPKTLDDLVNLRKMELGMKTFDKKTRESFLYLLLENGIFTARKVGKNYELKIPNRVTKLCVQRKILQLKYFREFVSDKEVERDEFRKTFYSLDGQLHNVEAFTNSVAKVFWRNTFKIRQAVQFVGPMYATLAEYSNVDGELFVSSDKNMLNSTKRTSIDMLVFGPDGKVIIIEERYDSPKAKNYSSPEETVKYILDRKDSIKDRIVGRNFVLAGIYMNAMSCGCCVLENTFDFLKKVCATVSKDSFE